MLLTQSLFCGTRTCFDDCGMLVCFYLNQEKKNKKRKEKREKRKGKRK